MHTVGRGLESTKYAMAYQRVYRRGMLGILLLYITLSVGCVWCGDGAVTTDAGTTASMTTEADASTDDMAQTDGGHTPLVNDFSTSATAESFTTGDSASNSPQSTGNATVIASTMATEEPPTRYGEIHWLLFTGWQMPLVMVCVEILAYCVTIFIVFGFGQKRSRVKRFGHFSWKRPNPFREQDNTRTTSRAVTAAREHYVGGTILQGTGSRLKAKKPSIRDHRP